MTQVLNDRRDMTSHESLQRRDVLVLVSYCLLLFGVAIVSGRPLTLHECVLPQSARAMLADGDFVIPKIDAKPTGTLIASMPTAPWLESPPLPQWITVALAAPFGRCDTESIVRIGPTLVGTGIVLLVAWMAAFWYGRSLGLLAGFVMATSFQFTRYCWLAEDEIYLCGVITGVLALFTKIEFSANTASLPMSNRGAIGRLAHMLFGSRSWWIVAFFLALGATNLVKGLIFGTVVASVPIASFLILSFEPRRFAKYVWFWGALLFLAVMLAWPFAVHRRYPDVLDLWHFDLFGRLSGQYAAINQPLWYYPASLPWMLAPWTLIIPLGLRSTWRRAWCDRTSPERLLWCWAFLVPAVLSIPGGKHHHYLLHAITPWAILAALGIRELRAFVPAMPRWWTHPATSTIGFGVPAAAALAFLGHKIPGPTWLPMALMLTIPLVALFVARAMLDRNAWRAGGVVFSLLLLGYSLGHCYAGHYLDSNRHDVAFLKSVRHRAETEKLPVLIDMSINPFHGLMGLFHQKADAVLLHNTSFLGASEIVQPEVFVVAIGSLQNEIAEWGQVETVETSLRVPRGMTEQDRLTLFRLRFQSDIARVPAREIRISPMQAMCRTRGPILDARIAQQPFRFDETVSRR